MNCSWDFRNLYQTTVLFASKFQTQKQRVFFLSDPKQVCQKGKCLGSLAGTSLLYVLFFYHFCKSHRSVAEVLVAISLVDSARLTFGKHKGKTFKEALQRRDSLIAFLCENMERFVCSENNGGEFPLPKNWP